MGFLDKPRRYFPLQDEFTICDVCGCNTLKLVPCSHWHCRNCGYDTRISDSKLSKLKKDYKEVRELNQKARERQWQLKKEKFVKCVDCKYSKPPTEDYLINHIEETCYKPSYVDTSNIEYGYDDNLGKYISCSYGKKNKLA